MSILKRLIAKPRSFTAREWIFQIHLWAGLIVALYVLLMSVTGAALVYREELERVTDPALYKAEATGPLASPQLIENRLLSHYPDLRMSFIAYPEKGRETIQIFLAPQPGVEGRSTQLFVHPVTAEVLGEVSPQATWLSWLQDLHFNLLTGRTGRIANGIGGFALTLLTLSGIVVWWPGARHWLRAMSIDWRRGWKRVNYDLHSATGFWTLAVVAMWAITGIYFTWATEFRQVLSLVLPMHNVTQPESAAQFVAQPRAGHLDQMLQHVAQANPSGIVMSIAYPLNPKATYRITLAPQGTWHPRGDVFYFDQYTGRQIALMRRSDPQPIGDTVMEWIGTIHFGDFGGWPVKAVWVLLGIAPGLLTVTGTLMWWNRWASKRAANWRSAPPATTRPQPVWSMEQAEERTGVPTISGSSD
ncbi:MAG: PepSY-associated TM helix domain-containing protein [Bryobacteraceae bacterium]